MPAPQVSLGPLSPWHPPSGLGCVALALAYANRASLPAYNDNCHRLTLTLTWPTPHGSN